MFSDFKELIATFNKHKVKYLIVGAYAVAIHAQPRATKDLDILIEPTPENADVLFRALKEFGAPLTTPDDTDRTARRDLTPADFTSSGAWYTMGVPPRAIDILPHIPGVAFATAWANRITHTVDAALSLSAHFISYDDLITAKLAAGRPQDLADVQALRDARDARSEDHTQSRDRDRGEGFL